MAFQVSDRRVGYILNKSETLHLNCFPFICKMMQASKAMKVYWVMHKVKGLRILSQGNT